MAGAGGGGASIVVVLVVVEGGGEREVDVRGEEPGPGGRWSTKEGERGGGGAGGAFLSKKGCILG